MSKNPAYDPVNRYFGKMYKDASLSAIQLPAEDMAKMNEWIKEDKTFFVYSGSVGVGKTHLMMCIANFIFNQKKKKGIDYPSVFCYPEDEIFLMISSTWNCIDRFEDEEKQKLFDHEYIFIDDLWASVTHPWQKKLVYTLINERYNSRRKTFITTNLSKEDVYTEMGDRIADRITGKDSVWIFNDSKSRRQQ